jgi:flagellar M-ring protein FliF
MDQLKKLLGNLTHGQQISIVICALAVAGILFSFVRWRREADFRPIYTGLAAEDAGAVVQKLKESGTDYRLSDNGSTILAPSEKLAELRLQMAGNGLPKTGRMGFEIFDKTNFGVTDFAEHINYRRALEGELERSIMSLAEVEKARVHLSFPKESIYLETRQPAKASVVLGLRGSVPLSPQNVSAVCNLVASAVEGLAPEAVSVVDMRGNLLNRPRKTGGDDGLEGSEANLEYRQAVEKDYAAKIQSTLEPVLGADRFRVAVSADCDFSGGEQSEETFDPSRSVMVSSQKSEDVAPVSLSGGIPGAAANLPKPPVRPAGATSGASRRSEEINYQSSRMVKRTQLARGEVKRLSVSLLVDQDMHWEGKPPNMHQVLVPPSAEKLKSIHDLVAGVISFKAERGDQLVVETLPFESTLHAEPPESPATHGTVPKAPELPVPAWMRNPKVIGEVAGGAVLFLVLVVVVLRKLRNRGGRMAEMPTSLPAGAPGSAPAALPGGGVNQKIEAHVADTAKMQERLEAEALEAIKSPNVTTNKTEVLTKVLREGLKKDPIVQVQTLRTWLHEKS